MSNHSPMKLIKTCTSTHTHTHAHTHTHTHTHIAYMLGIHQSKISFDAVFSIHVVRIDPNCPSKDTLGYDALIVFHFIWSHVFNFRIQGSFSTFIYSLFLGIPSHPYAIVFSVDFLQILFCFLFHTHSYTVFCSTLTRLWDLRVDKVPTPASSVAAGGSLSCALMEKNLKQSWLSAFWKKEDPKHTRDQRERFLIGQKRRKRAHFRESPLFQATYNIKTEKRVSLVPFSFRQPSSI